ncbi:Las1-domain-containing protein [Obba rivulosa]|uniref:Las1-domain-containing protein n=1 Tax=Obba rivulosa TaxID=1052685 RepID=A0A8E2B2C2_9APHY|nr:Las1-domain-containing protein [Obba rivulosa]
MKLPHRVPWASIGELEQVCSWIYADETDHGAKTRAVNRLSAWRAVTSLPHALESALAILVVTLQDAQSQGAIPSLLLRQSYASAIIRLVNGLVDPLQLGAYARSIASIASQLGVPAWFVELRHAATHEDLPSLEVLREAARESMAWLLHNYFLPTLNPSAPPSSRSTTVRPLTPILNRYKALLKATTRDVSLLANLRPDITKVLRDIERWVAEAKVAASASAGELDWASSHDVPSPGEADWRERWALERLCDALTEKGALVPLSKKKRMLGTQLVPPASVLNIWTLLLDHLQALHPDLRSVLVFKIVSRLISHSNAQKEFPSDNVPLAAMGHKADVSYDLLLAAWANWLVCAWTPAADYAEEGAITKEDVIINLTSALGPRSSSNADSQKGAQALLKALCAGRPNLEKSLTALHALSPQTTSKEWTEDDLSLMDERLRNLLAVRQASEMVNEVSDGNTSNALPNGIPMEEDSSLPPGWRVVSAGDGWKPSPIGVFVRSHAELSGLSAVYAQ